MSELIWRTGAGDLRLESVGGKAATLALLASKGIAVPPFFVVTSAAYALHLGENGIAWPDQGGIREAPLPMAVRRAVLDAYRELVPAEGPEQVAVRSSGAEEDSAAASFAGQFDSFLGVGTDGLLDAVKACWASYLSEPALRYRANRGIPLADSPTFGVIVQRQLFPKKAGVLFTVHPIDPDQGVSYLEANYGTAESVVGGLVTPDAVTVSRSDQKVLGMRVGAKLRMTVVSPLSPGSRVEAVDPGLRDSPVLADSEALGIFRMGLQIEEILGQPQDIEWAIDAEGIWVVQARPLTTWTGGIVGY